MSSHSSRPHSLVGQQSQLRKTQTSRSASANHPHLLNVSSRPRARQQSPQQTALVSVPRNQSKERVPKLPQQSCEKQVQRSSAVAAQQSPQQPFKNGSCQPPPRPPPPKRPPPPHHSLLPPPPKFPPPSLHCTVSSQNSSQRSQHSTQKLDVSTQDGHISHPRPTLPRRPPPPQKPSSLTQLPHVNSTSQRKTASEPVKFQSPSLPQPLSQISENSTVHKLQKQSSIFQPSLLNALLSKQELQSPAKISEASPFHQYLQQSEISHTHQGSSQVHHRMPKHVKLPPILEDSTQASDKRITLPSLKQPLTFHHSCYDGQQSDLSRMSSAPAEASQLRQRKPIESQHLAYQSLLHTSIPSEYSLLQPILQEQPIPDQTNQNLVRSTEEQKFFQLHQFPAHPKPRPHKWLARRPPPSPPCFAPLPPTEPTQELIPPEKHISELTYPNSAESTEKRKSLELQKLPVPPKPLPRRQLARRLPPPPPSYPPPSPNDTTREPIAHEKLSPTQASKCKNLPFEPLPRRSSIQSIPEEFLQQDFQPKPLPRKLHAHKPVARLFRSVPDLTFQQAEMSECINHRSLKELPKHRKARRSLPLNFQEECYLSKPRLQTALNCPKTQDMSVRKFEMNTSKNVLPLQEYEAIVHQKPSSEPQYEGVNNITSTINSDELSSELAFPTIIESSCVFEHKPELSTSQNVPPLQEQEVLTHLMSPSEEPPVPIKRVANSMKSYELEPKQALPASDATKMHVCAHELQLCASQTPFSQQQESISFQMSGSDDEAIQEQEFPSTTNFEQSPPHQASPTPNHSAQHVSVHKFELQTSQPPLWGEAFESFPSEESQSEEQDTPVMTHSFTNNSSQAYPHPPLATKASQQAPVVFQTLFYKPRADCSQQMQDSSQQALLQFSLSNVSQEKAPFSVSQAKQLENLTYSESVTLVPKTSTDNLTQLMFQLESTSIHEPPSQFSSPNSLSTSPIYTLPFTFSLQSPTHPL